MKANLSRQMTFLGLGAMVFYTMLLSSGEASIEILPQYAISIVFFLFSSKMLRQSAKASNKQTEEDGPQPNWALRTLVLNWVAAGLIICAITVFLVKPPGMTFYELLTFTSENHSFPALAMP